MDDLSAPVSTGGKPLVECQEDEQDDQYRDDVSRVS
jgi:hypothetical protein